MPDLHQIPHLDEIAHHGEYHGVGKRVTETFADRYHHQNKVVPSLEDAIRLTGLRDGMTISFHHHFRNGDHIVNMVLDKLAEMGFHDLKLAASSLSAIHAPLIRHIQNGVITHIETSGMRGELAEAVSRGLMDCPVVFRSHGGRASAIRTGELHIDVAFLGAPSCDPYGNANGYSRDDDEGIACGSLGYARPDAAYADETRALEDEQASNLKNAVLTGKQKLVLVLFALSFLIMIVSFIPWESFGINIFAIGGTADDPSTAWSAVLTGLPLGQWYFTECGIWFFVISIVIGFVGGLSEKEIVNTFIAGAADMMSVVLIIALARGISVLMAATGLDTYVLTQAANALSGVSGILFAPLAWILYFGLSFLIPSTSGMATVSMPIMGPLAAQLGFSPEVMVMIFSSAIGVVNLFTPTSGAIMGGLALARIEWTTWLKFALKIVVVLSVVSAVICTVAIMVL